ncbi:hypothetical protein A8709_17385 [Paenibacillus pectinilyticus]|uniref:Uncharacterized protein n=1 Tax=Paenibacillus pectinilyticus TaxID=512399 RepID=A0A1C0ZZ16_9BACL|nr:hypothetical protein A8709_17385 [Paenibacillus pectinilyticus]
MSKSKGQQPMLLVFLCEKARGYAHVSIYQVREKISLGQCLNSGFVGFVKTKFPLIAKFGVDVAFLRNGKNKGFKT